MPGPGCLDQDAWSLAQISKQQTCLGCFKEGQNKELPGSGEVILHQLMALQTLKRLRGAIYIASCPCVSNMPLSVVSELPKAHEPGRLQADSARLVRAPPARQLLGEPGLPVGSEASWKQFEQGRRSETHLWILILLRLSEQNLSLVLKH